MHKLLSALCLVLLIFALSAADHPSKAREPLLYELVINGESFTIEANRSLKLDSQKQPGVSYDVALRVAQVQRLALNQLHIDYDRGFEVSEDQNAKVRTATLEHELGFTMAISDLGGPLGAENRQKVLDTLRMSLEQTFRAAKATDVTVGKPHQRKFGDLEAQGLVIQYQDAAGMARTCLIYVLDGKRFTASCIVQFVDDDHDTVLPLVKKTLESVQARR